MQNEVTVKVRRVTKEEDTSEWELVSRCFSERIDVRLMFTHKMCLWLVVYLHTGQTLIYAVGKIAVLLCVWFLWPLLPVLLTVICLSPSMKKEEVIEAA